jgi:hypothetical protein
MKTAGASVSLVAAGVSRSTPSRAPLRSDSAFTFLRIEFMFVSDEN